MSWFAQPGHAVDRVERAHRGVRTGVDRRLERRQVEVAQRGLGHVGGVVLAAALRGAVGGEVLGARGNLVRGRVVAALVTLDPGRGEDRPEVGVLAAALRASRRRVPQLGRSNERASRATSTAGRAHRRGLPSGPAQRSCEQRPVADERRRERKVLANARVGALRTSRDIEHLDGFIRTAGECQRKAEVGGIDMPWAAWSLEIASSFLPRAICTNARFRMTCGWAGKSDSESS